MIEQMHRHVLALAMARREGIPTFLADLSYARQMIIFSRVSAKAFWGLFLSRVSAIFWGGVFGVFFWCFGGVFWCFCAFGGVFLFFAR